MKIQKFLHSCLSVELNGQRIIIDPGGWSSPTTEIGAADIILITHEHQDHFSVQKVKELLALRQATIIANESITKLLADEGVIALTIEDGQTMTMGEFTIEAITAPHGDLPVPKPHNNGYLINKTLFTPGDSFTFTLTETPRAIALPIAAPWGTTTRAVELGLALKPMHIIPVHEQVLRPDFIPRVMAMCGKVFTGAGIDFHPLQPGETLEV
jgi:L-ascorbate metabolism protein UlaG (beta-lactamase superfamily)